MVLLSSWATNSYYNNSLDENDNISTGVWALIVIIIIFIVIGFIWSLMIITKCKNTNVKIVGFITILLIDPWFFVLGFYLMGGYKSLC